MSKNTRELSTAILILVLSGLMLLFAGWTHRLHEQNDHLRRVNRDLAEKIDVQRETFSKCCGALMSYEEQADHVNVIVRSLK